MIVGNLPGFQADTYFSLQVRIEIFGVLPKGDRIIGEDEDCKIMGFVGIRRFLNLVPYIRSC